MQETVSQDYIENKIRIATEGFEFEHQSNKIRYLTIRENALAIANFLIECKNEGVGIGTRVSYTFTLCLLSEHVKKPFIEFTRDDNLSYLDSHRKTEDADPKHKWKGSYNLRKIHLGKFFKWLKKSEVMEGIHTQKRKEKSSYSPSDLWTSEENIVFLRYCPSVRIRCYHMMAIDSSCRPHEILKLKIRDIVFKQIDGKHYAEILVNGKTGSRHIPLIHSIPYVKEWLDAHPIKSNPNAPFICGQSSGLGRKVTTDTLNKAFASYKTEFFPKLLNNPEVPQEDKDIIATLLNKPWNPYTFRHTALTEKSKFLKEHILRSHAGWSMNSNMPQVYLHYFGNESSESILEAYGLKPSTVATDKLKPVQCPNCGIDNKLDSKFCAKCRLALTMQAWNEAIEEKDSLKNELDEFRKEMQEMKSTIVSQTFEAVNTKIQSLEAKGITGYRKDVTKEYIEKEYEMREREGIPVENRVLIGNLLDPTEAEFINQVDEE